ncbi:MAG: hypothetical protein LYZ69_05350 [Nitrososphaerales archaeon]|nr:hypothetical protein [Nitrososphaerales archaeon]
MVEVFLDQQALGLRAYLDRAGIKVRDVTEILGNRDTRKGVPDAKVQEFVADHPGVILVTKDKKFGRKAKDAGLSVIFVNESEAVAIEVLRQLALAKL